MNKLPIVAIIGQTNAGKSSLFNRLTRSKTAIVAREAGTTRDNVVSRVNNQFILIDTAGLKDPSDEFEATIQDQIDDAISSADLILLTLDSSKYTNHDDKLIAKKALKSGKPTILALNKSDLGNSLPAHEFRNLGIKELIHVSATTGYGCDDLKSKILSLLSASGALAYSSEETVEEGRLAPTSSRLQQPAPREDGRARERFSEEENASVAPTKLKIALIGRPNVGKSSLFNSLAKKQQAIVADLSGTTRDINRIEVKYKGRTIELLDTAGLRKPGKREVGIEKFSAVRTLAAIEESDLCCLLIDGTEPRAKLDQALAGQIIEAGKGIIFVVTKTDLLDEITLENVIEPSYKKFKNKTKKSVRHNKEVLEEPEEKPKQIARNTSDIILDHIQNDFNFIPYAPVILTSSVAGKNVTKIFELAEKIDQERHVQIKTSELNKILGDAIITHPPAGLKNTTPKLRYITQTDTCPPWFTIYGSELSLLHWSYKRFLERRIREKFPFVGTPIFFSFRNRD